MAEKNDTIKMEGVVIEVLRGTKFIVLLENNKKCTCTISGKLRKNFIKIIAGDKVSVEISVYDLTKGRIIWRYK